MDDELNNRLIFFSPWSFLFLFFLIIIGNLFIIDVALFWNNPKTTEKVGTTTVVPTVQPSKSLETTSCSTACQAEISKAVSIAIASKNTPIKQPAPPTQQVKEYFIPLGSGSSTSSEWEDIPGVQAYIDSNAYGKIKTLTFEVSLYTPTGNQSANARLYNVTDKHPVWNSEVGIEGGVAQLKISPLLTLDSGSKLYQVQMKTQLQARTNLENARVHITTF